MSVSVSHSAIITFQGSSEIREQEERLSEDLSRPALFVTSVNKELVKAEGCETELIRWVAVGWARPGTGTISTIDFILNSFNSAQLTSGFSFNFLNRWPPLIMLCFVLSYLTEL